MRITNKGTTALACMIELAKEGKCLSLQALAKKHDTSVKYLEHIFRDLKKANLVDSHRGNEGGYFLSHPVAFYNCKIIILAVEERLGIEDEVKRTSLLQPMWNGLAATTYKKLESISLSYLLKQYEEEQHETNYQI